VRPLAALRLLLALAGVAAAVLIGVFVLGRSAPSTCAPCGPDGPYITSAEGWSLPALQGGGTVSLAQFRGHPVVATFFASWCTACRDELPAFLQLSHTLPDVRFVGIDSEEYGDGARFAAGLGLGAWPLARDVGGAGADGLHESLTTEPGMPITAIYGSSGSLVDVRIGAESAAELAADLRQYAGVGAS
jgi:thiol-disulfide isomerase/thioredoxin